MVSLPQHLQKYVVQQRQDQYTPVDHAVWRFILKQLKDFLTVHAHPCYLEGLKKTGINLERIPLISEVDARLKDCGWRAVPVSGFIPPAAFMEMQSYGVLPIAADMRSIETLMYTPAPDIVHEAAGHAPILINPDFSAYLHRYAEVANKAILAKHDLDQYTAIRELSDVKEHPNSTEAQIQQAENKLNKINSQIQFISEAGWLSRMNWWTAEYGLIGDIKKPKIYGAGLLSSVGESRSCMTDKVKKLPLTIECIEMGYDITEPQPQLYVTPDFQTLITVLEELADKMAFRKGGLHGLQKAMQAQTVNTIEYNSGLQVSGKLTQVHFSATKEPAYLQMTGPTQLSVQNNQLEGHGVNHHKEGFGSPIGKLDKSQQCLSTWSDDALRSRSIVVGQSCTLRLQSGVLVVGTVRSLVKNEGRLVIISFSDCTVTYEGKTLFEPAWGIFDMAVGDSITSVFGGPADRAQYSAFTDDFVSQKVPTKTYSVKELQLHQFYAQVRSWREENRAPNAQTVEQLVSQLSKFAPEEWLLFLEIWEVSLKYKLPIEERLRKRLAELSLETNNREVIEDGLRLMQSAVS